MTFQTCSAAYLQERGRPRRGNWQSSYSALTSHRDRLRSHDFSELYGGGGGGGVHAHTRRPIRGELERERQALCFREDSHLFYLLCNRMGERRETGPGNTLEISSVEDFIMMVMDMRYLTRCVRIRAGLWGDFHSVISGTKSQFLEWTVTFREAF